MRTPPSATRPRSELPLVPLGSVALCLASLLVVHTASASEPVTKDTGGKGGPGPGATQTPQEGGNAGDADEEYRVRQLNLLKAGAGAEVAEEEEDPFAPKYKPWEVSVGYSTHRLIYNNDLEGGAANQFANSFDASIDYSITKHDHVAVRAYVMERFLADAGESGWRFDDMNFSYGHDFSLPQKFKLGLGLSATAPTSYYSQLASQYTTLRASLSVDRRFGPLSLGFRTYAQWDVEKYSSVDANQNGGAPTSVFGAGFAGDAELHMPFHEPLTLAVGAGTGYGWVHTVPGQNPATSDQYYPNTQPVNQSYGFEASLRYALPALLGVKSDVTLGYGDGGPGVGYSSVLHDGVGHLYLGFRTASDIFLSLSAAY